MLKRFVIAGWILVVIATGCAEPAGTGQATAIATDSAGVVIVENGVLDPGRDILVSSTPEVQIGVVEGAPELQLFQVSDVKRLGDGSIAMANAGSRELRIYRPDGSHRATAGGSGGGPSQFRYPMSISILAGDTIRVQDMMDRVYFTADGVFVRRESTDRAALAALWGSGEGRPEGGQWLADGSLFAPIYKRDQGTPMAGPLFRPQMTLVRVSNSLSSVDTIGVFGGAVAGATPGWGSGSTASPRARMGRDGRPGGQAVLRNGYRGL